MMMGSPEQFEDQQSVSPYLTSSEKIIWTGRPPTGILFRKSDGMLIPFGLLWVGFAVFWEYTAYNSGAPAFFLLFGGAFVIVGLFLFFGRFMYDKWIRQNTVYALTNERVLILTGLFSRSLKALNLKALPEISLQLLNDGRGTITFGTSQGYGFVRYSPGWPGMSQFSPPMFERIENASEIYKLIQSVTTQ